MYIPLFLDLSRDLSSKTLKRKLFCYGERRKKACSCMNLKLCAVVTYTIAFSAIVIGASTSTVGLLGVSLGFSLMTIGTCVAINLEDRK